MNNLMYKAKRTDNGKRIYGHVHYLLDKTFIINPNIKILNCNFETIDKFFVEVIPETVFEFKGHLQNRSTPYKMSYY